MKSLKTKLADHIRSYFSEYQAFGFCQHFRYGNFHLFGIFEEYAKRWPYSLKYVNGDLMTYFIPASKDNLCAKAAVHSYRDGGDQAEKPMRRELANFILREIAREQKNKFVPIA